MKLGHRIVVIGFVVTLALGISGVAAAISLDPSTSPLSAAAQFNGRVSSLLVVDNTVYVGGSFTSARNSSGQWVVSSHLAAVDGTTGVLIDAWHASVNGAVNALATDGTQLYVGGSFSSISGASRINLGAVSLATGQVTDWAPPAPNKAVYALSALGGRLFAGGLFLKVGTSARGRLAAFDTVTAALDPSWTPQANGKVQTITPSALGDQLYVGGIFTAFNGDSTYGYEAGVDTVIGAATGWPTTHAYYPINQIVVSDDGVFAAGNGPGGQVVAWAPDGTFLSDPYQTDGGVQALVAEPGQIFAGGHFTNVCLGNTGGGSPFICTNPLPRAKLFGIDLTSSTYTAWNPKANSSLGVFAMAVVPSSGMLVVGGDFTKINGLPCQHFALFPPNGTAASP